MDIKKTAQEIHDNAVKHGWWETSRNPAEIIALCHSELSEALEEFRGEARGFYFSNKSDADASKPEGWAVEMVDCVIRIFDFLEHQGVDIEMILKEKMAYNLTRPYKHGRKF